MMNLTISHPIPTFGDAFTITCYVCGMPSSKEWAQKARSRPCTPMKPYFPFLLQLTPLGGAVLREDGSTYLCAFCHGSLEAQWNVYESQQVVPPPNRKYNIQKFICAVCGVETYRKRIRALPFQEFPFLEKQRQAGSITLGNNPLAVVCLDCSETLWAQSAEYDRWGLPVHKRHFNWMARPPPPEDSVEATVARLPSGETQLPRCPPIEPTLTPKAHENPALKVTEPPVSKVRGKGKSESPKLDSSSPIPHSSRKTSMTSITPPSIDMITGFHSQQPPVVTVAPMSSHSTVLSIRKDSLGIPPGLIPTHAGSGAPGIYPQPPTAVYPPAAQYAPYVWSSGPARDASQRAMEAYPYGGPEGMHGPPGVWPWLPQPSPELLRYQSYVSSLQSRAHGDPTSRSPTHNPTVSSPSIQPYTSGSSPSRVASSSSASRSSDVQQRSTDGVKLTRPSGGSSSSEDLSYLTKELQDLKQQGKRSPKSPSRVVDVLPSVQKAYPTHPKKISKDHSSSASQVATLRASGGSGSSQQAEKLSVIPEVESAEERVVRRECHIPKKRNWQVFMKESQAATVSENPSRTAEDVPHPKKKKSSVSAPENAELSTFTAHDSCVGLSKDDSAVGIGSKSPKYGRSGSGSPGNVTESRSRSTDSAIDLTVSGVPLASKHSLKGAGAKFRIEYLCQSESHKQSDEDNIMSGDDTASRSSVIKCVPKVPAVAPMDTSCPESSQDDELKLSVSESPSVASEENKLSKGVASPSAQSAAAREIEGEVGMGDDLAVKDRKSDGEEGLGEGESLDQASKMNTDDDDISKSENSDLQNVEQFIKETVTELVNRQKEKVERKRVSTEKQKEFLQELGLITPLEKTEIEIKSVVSRHERKTLPPLQLRPGSSLGRKIDKELKEMLLKVSIEDPTLFEGKPELEKSDFMAELGMKTAEKSDKTKREIKWRVILMERMRRELRDAAARGIKHEWEKSEILKKFAHCDLDSFFSSMSYAALFSSDEDLNQEEKEEASNPTADNAPDTSATAASGICINYPKYIPSYAVKSEGEELESTKSGGGEPADAPESGSSQSYAEPILKIPVLPSSSARLQSELAAAATLAATDDESGTKENDSSQSAMEAPANEASLSPECAPTPTPVRLDNLIESSTLNWQQMKQGIDEILESLESSKEEIPQEEKTSQLEKIQKHLKSQLGDIKEMEKRLRLTGKSILSASRKRSTSHNQK